MPALSRATLASRFEVWPTRAVTEEQTRGRAERETAVSHADAAVLAEGREIVAAMVPPVTALTALNNRLAALHGRLSTPGARVPVLPFKPLQQPTARWFEQAEAFLRTGVRGGSGRAKLPPRTVALVESAEHCRASLVPLNALRTE